MTSTLLNIAGKIDPKTVAIFKTVSRTIAELEIPYVVVGATARDIVLHYGHGAKIQRATHDVDFALEVPSWAAFNALKDKLCEQGFNAAKAQHRLTSRTGAVIDIVPFGDVEDDNASIAWPPKGDIKMSVLGFQEACNAAEWVRIQDDPELDIPVATPAGMVLLKLIAWADRESDVRKKDAEDVAYLLSTYENIPEIVEALYDASNTEMMDAYDWDVTQSAAHILGQHAKSIAQADTLHEIARLASGKLGVLNAERLAEEMCGHASSHYDTNERLLAAFFRGFGINE